MKLPDLLSRIGLYFYSGNELQINLIKESIKKLETLIKAVEEAKGIKWYSTGILLIYEGNKEKRLSEKTGITLKLIDLAKTVFDKKS